MPFARLALIASAVFAVSQPAAAVPWATRLDRIGNFSSQPVQVLDPAPGGLRLTLRAGDSAATPGLVVPVCRNAREFKRKALQVRSHGGRYLNALCQDARDHTVYKVRRGQFWLSRDRCADRAYGDLRVSIDAAGRVYCYGYDRQPDPEDGVLME